MTLIDDLLALMPVEEIPIRDLRIGLHWTAVCSLGCGLAATYTNDSPPGQHRLRDVGRLHNKSAQELAGWLRSDDPLEAALGLAAFNSLITVEYNRITDRNAFDLLYQLGADKKIAVIGHFPQVDQLRRAVKTVWVIEKRPLPGDYPAEAAVELLPQADFIAITGSSLINHTLEGLLALCPPNVPVMLIGPSTPLVPMLFDRGITHLSGTIIVNEAAALLAIQQGAVFSQVQGARRVILSRHPLS
jgi:uncharacterized protein (DUF4213/DUF364 family)